jgi:formyl-CoA transferase
VETAVAELTRAGVPAAPVRSYAEAARDPHVLERDMVQWVAQAEGSAAPITGPAAKLSRTPLSVRRGARALGADTDEVLEQLGVDAARRRALREAGVI